MKSLFLYIIIILFLTPVLIAAPGGGGYDGYRHFSASINVEYPDGSIAAGVEVRLMAIAYGSEGDGTDMVYGTTNSGGWVNLSTDVYYFGWEEGHFMSVSVTDDDYTVISSSNTSSSVSYTIYPCFEVRLDADHNGIHDPWELPLAEKFCPSFKLSNAEKWIAPEPVEIMNHTMYWCTFNLAGYFTGDYEMWNTDGVNYSWYENPFMYGANTLVIGHFEWAGTFNDPDSWHLAYQNERNNNNYSHTIYAHFFKESNYIVIQYWIFYPFNDGYNNHEGDWEHINVLISDQNPNVAQILYFDFYFHHKVQSRYPSECEIEANTHVKIYVGGSGSITFPIPNSEAVADGGSYPETGWWDAVHEINFVQYDEYVAGLGPYIPYSSFIDGNPSDGRGIVILPEPDQINYNEHPEMSWLKAEVAFGHLLVSSPFDWNPFGSVGNEAVGGPYYNDGWNETGAVSGAFELYTDMPHW